MKLPVSQLGPQPTLEKPRQRGRLNCLEWLLILFIIAILFAILVPGGVRNRAQGQLTACKSNLKNLSIALEMYASDHQGRYPSGLTQLTPNYLKTIPQCPAGVRETTYNFWFGKRAPGNVNGVDDYVYIRCNAPIHQKTWGSGRNYWAISTTQGLIDAEPDN